MNILIDTLGLTGDGASGVGRISSASFLVLLICAALLIYGLAIITYRIYFHPLSQYPGPLLARFTRLRLTYYVLTGNHIYDTERLHLKYGDVVRVAPDELSYIATAAWKDIQGHKSGRGDMEKDHVFFNTISAGPLALPALRRTRHGEIRRLVAHSFSAAALKDQEPIIQGFVDLFTQRLHVKCAAGPIEISAWFNFLTFDITGDLVFGEPFGCLDSTSYHPWVRIIFDAVKLSVWLQVPTYYPLFAPLIRWIIPKRLVEARKTHKQTTYERFRRRMERKTDHIDFIVKLVEPGNGVSEEEMVANAELLVGAGSETTATLLSGAVYLLLQNPSTMDRLSKEVRTTFNHESEITFKTLGDLKYMDGVINESLRMYPPVPGRLPRRVPVGGDEIIGRYVPGDTVVSMAPWAVNHSPKHYYLPYEFRPERWLDEEACFAEDDRGSLHPFSIGPRTCLGQNLAHLEMRLALAKLIWNFDMKLMPESIGWLETQKSYFLWQKPALMVQLTPFLRR